MSQPVSSDRDDPERDAWLSQALRHAPDAGSDAPLALSDAILREARAAVTRPAVSTPVPPRESPAHWLVSAWSWLARPPVAAGFASVMVATLVGIMWWDQPLDESLPRSSVPVAAAPQARADAAPAVVADPPPAQPAARGSVLAERERAAPPVAPAAAPKPAETARAPARAAKTEAPARVRPVTPAAEPTRERVDADTGTAPAVPAPPATQPPPAPQVADKMTAEATADKAAAPRHNELRAAQGSAARVAPSPVDAVGSALAELRSAINRQPERWSSQRGGDEARALNPTLQRWLFQLDQSTAARWNPTAERAPPEASGRLRLLRDGVPQATLVLGAGRVWLETAGAATPAASMATLPQASIDALIKALDETAR